ncbi:MAG: HIT domain-containing protein [Streptomycetaceae bacterium]|nr:HIT domain-containing protein [Streptomycetaceae bacterium]
MRPDCVFCRPRTIATPVTVVRAPTSHLECLVFEPLNPVTPGHLLVVPTLHVESAAADPYVAAAAMEVAAEHIHERRLSANIITSIGADATQTVSHLHVHIVPRVAGDGLHLPWTGQRVSQRAA